MGRHLNSNILKDTEDDFIIPYKIIKKGLEYVYINEYDKGYKRLYLYEHDGKSKFKECFDRWDLMFIERYGE